MSLKKKTQKFLRERGIRIEGFRPYHSEIHQVTKASARAGCETLFDVGANVGQFASECFEAGFSGKVISVEPQSSAYARLMKRAVGNPRWVVAPRCAVGEQIGQTEIHLSENSVSSSLMDVTHFSTDINSQTKFVGSEIVEVATLDILAPKFAPKGNLAIKIDTQGYEAAVLRGAAELMPRISVLYLEMSLAPLYVGAPAFEELYLSIQQLGFRCIGLFPGFVSTTTFEVMQVNGLFTKLPHTPT